MLRALAVATALGVGCGGEPSDEGSLPAPPGEAPAPPSAPDPPDAAPAPPGESPPAGPVAISFKLDPRLTTGAYLGERWVSPAVFSIALDGEGFVEARARCLDPNGAETEDVAAWTPAQGGLIAVTPSRGSPVRITIARAGEGTLAVACGTFARELAVRAFELNGVLRAEIAQ